MERFILRKIYSILNKRRRWFYVEPEASLMEHGVAG
jgi:hypothetical protein